MGTHADLATSTPHDMGAADLSAAASSCTVDIDCPTSACGGQVCEWTAAAHTCVAAGTDPQGSDGWCTTTADCKCMGAGATCAGTHCTFTVPPGSDLSVSAPDLSTTKKASGSSSCAIAGHPDSSLAWLLSAALLLLIARRRRPA